MVFLRIAFIGVVFSFLFGCTTASYGRQFKPVIGEQDQFRMVISTGGFAGKEVATLHLETKEIPKFLKQNPQYKSYEIISKEFKLIPSGVTFIVQFYPT